MPAVLHNGVVADRLLIFAGDTIGVPDRLVRATLAAVDARADVTIVGICLPAPTSRWRRWRKRAFLNLVGRVKAWCDPAQRREPYPRTVDLDSEAAAREFPILVAPGGDANDPDFVGRLRDEIRPTLALSVYWPRRWGDELLGRFGVAANYHNGSLPAYRGLRATAWSVVDGEATSGYAFHRMTRGLDEGPVLAAGAVGVDAGAHVADLDAAKAAAAARVLPDVLAAMVARAPGVAQTGIARYRSRADAEAMTTVESPSSLTLDEIQRRLRAFCCVRMRLGGELLPVTGLRVRTGARGRSAFTTADGVDVEVARVRYLPPAGFRLFRRWLRRES